MAEELPAKVTLAHLTRAERTCPRRLRLEHANTRANFSSNGRWQISNRVTEDVRLAHTDLVAPGLDRFDGDTPDLTAEQRHVYDLATGWYVTLFPRPARVVDDDGWSTDLPGDLRLVGRAGLAFTDADSAPELRLLAFAGRPRPAIPLVERPAVRFALLRRETWLDGRPVRVTEADLVHGTLEEDEIDTGAVMPSVRDWIRTRIDVLQSRIAEARETPGLQCAWCPYIAGCPPMSGRA